MPEPGSAPRRVVCVVGTGPDDRTPSATDTVAATLEALGAGAVPASWVAALHAELLGRCGVAVDDARPTAWFDTGKLAANGITRARVTDWLGGQFVHPAGERAGEPRTEVVLGDPGLSWLLGLWRAAALRCDAEVAHVLVLRPAADVGPGGQVDPGMVAAWVNRALHLERATRGSPRVLLRYAEVTADWTIPLVQVGRDLGLRTVQEATANQIRRGHEVVASGPVAGAGEWPPTIPPPMRELADATWAALTAEEGPDPVELDGLRAGYLELYSAAESITGSTVAAALRAAAGGPLAEPRPGSPGLGDRARRGVRRALGR